MYVQGQRITAVVIFYNHLMLRVYIVLRHAVDCHRSTHSFLGYGKTFKLFLLSMLFVLVSILYASFSCTYKIFAPTNAGRTALMHCRLINLNLSGSKARLTRPSIVESRVMRLQDCASGYCVIC